MNATGKEDELDVRKRHKSIYAKDERNAKKSEITKQFQMNYIKMLQLAMVWFKIRPGNDRMNGPASTIRL